MKNVCIIYTGGTIGMEKTAYGYAPRKNYLKAQLASLKELQHETIPSYEFLEYEPLLDSSDVGPAQWCQIARDIEKRYHSFDGFVILHGTDTMAYTASALSFMLENLAKPVILTGSQIPFCEIRNDAKNNLITSMLIAAGSSLPEVCIFFGDVLLRGNRATKSSADALNAFESPNYPPLATAGVEIVFRPRPPEKRAEAFRLPAGPLRLCAFENQRIAVVKLFPGIRPETLGALLLSRPRGLVLEAFGAGNAGTLMRETGELFRRASEEGTVIVVCSQCLQGSAVIGEYEASRVLAEAGAVSGFDLTVEAAVTKLYYLLSRGDDPASVRRHMTADLRGEITVRSGSGI